MRSHSPNTKECGDVPGLKLFFQNRDCTVQEMAFFDILSSASTSTNSIVCHDEDVSSFGKQYEKLLDYIDNATEAHKSQLTCFVYPIFVHLYLELITNGAKEEAQKFFEKHSIAFGKNSRECQEMVNQLSTIASPDDLEAHPHFKLFRDKRFVVKVSVDCMEHLAIYLKEANLLVLMQLLNLHFSPEYESEVSGESTNSEDEASAENGTYSQETQSVINAISALEQAIKEVNDEPISMPSVCVYNIDPGSNRFSSVGLSHNYSLLAAGFEESFIQLWNVTSDALPKSSSSKQLGTFKNGYLNTQCQKQVLKGHCGAVYGISFHPQKEYLFSCSADTTVRAWCISSYKNVAVYSGHNYPVWNIDVSPYGLYFATASKDSTALLWTPDRLYPLRMFAGHDADVNCVKFHPNCKYVATGSSDKTVKLWNVQDGRSVRLFLGHEASVRCVAFSPNGRLLASAGEDRKIKIWDISTGLLLANLCDQEDIISSLSFSYDCSKLVSCGVRNTIQLWNTSESVLQSGLAAIKYGEGDSPICSCVAGSSMRMVSFSPRNVVVGVGVQTTNS